MSQRIISSVVSVGTGGGGTVLKEETGNISYVRIENLDGTNPIHVHHGDDNATTSNGAVLAAGGILEINLPGNSRISNRIIAIATGGAVNTLVDVG